MIFKKQTLDGKIVLEIEYRKFKFLEYITANHIKQNIQKFSFDRLKETCRLHDEMEEILNHCYDDSKL